MKKYKKGDFVVFLDSIVMQVETYDTEHFIILIPKLELNNNFIIIAHEDAIRDLRECDGLAYNLYK